MNQYDRCGYWFPRSLIEKSNAAMEAVCKVQKNVHFIRTAKPFLNEERKPRAELFREDRLHLNADGYKLWTKIVRKVLDKDLAEPAVKSAE